MNDKWSNDKQVAAPTYLLTYLPSLSKFITLDGQSTRIMSGGLAVIIEEIPECIEQQNIWNTNDKTSSKGYPNN